MLVLVKLESDCKNNILPRQEKGKTDLSTEGKGRLTVKN